MDAPCLAVAKASFSATLGALLAFLRDPRPASEPLEPVAARIATGIWLFLLSLLITAGFAVMALPLILVAEAAPGDRLRQTFAQSIPTVLVAVIVLGPLIEEVIFRGWLTGTWRAIAGSAVFLAIVLGGAPLLARSLGGPAVIGQLGLAGLALTLVWLLAPLDRGPRVPGYERAFPILFWGQGIVFGALHLGNVTSGWGIISLFSTLPLIACGWLWGYARIVLGLQGAFLLHAAYNVPATIGLLALPML